jgi:integrase
MCFMHYQRRRNGWANERMGEPRAGTKRRATSIGERDVRIDLAQLRAERLAFVGSAQPTWGLEVLHRYRIWLEELAASDPAALHQREEVLVTAYLASLHDRGLAASSLDVAAAGIRWTARRTGREDPTLHTTEMRRAARRAAAPKPIAREVDLDGLEALVDALEQARWTHHRRDPEHVPLLARAVFLTQLHLAGRHDDLANLTLDDVVRRPEGWRVVPWVRKNWPGGTPDGLWLVPTRDRRFDPVAAMDAWMEFRRTLSDTGYVFCRFRAGAWRPDEHIWYPHHNRFVTELGRLAGVGHITTHTLRRSTAQVLAAQGASEPELLRLLGHRDLRTLRVYQQRSGPTSAAAQMLELYREAA